MAKLLFWHIGYLFAPSLAISLLTKIWKEVILDQANVVCIYRLRALQVELNDFIRYCFKRNTLLSATPLDNLIFNISAI